MIDSHCHLAGEEFQADLADVVARAVSAGVTGSLVIIAADDELETSERTWSPGCGPVHGCR